LRRTTKANTVKITAWAILSMKFFIIHLLAGKRSDKYQGCRRASLINSDHVKLSDPMLGFALLMRNL
jgi:hypothetical protein